MGRRWIMGLVVAGTCLCTIPSVVAGQLTPADSAAVLLRTAEEFEREGEPRIAAALYAHITEHFGQTPAAAEAQSRLLGSGDRFDPVSSLELPVFGTLYGLWLGVAVPAAFGADSNAAYGAGLLIGGPLGLFGARAAQRSRQYTEGQARAISWGGIFGTWQGLGWAEVADWGTESICGEFGCYESDDNGEQVLASMVLGGLAGITAGAIIASNPVRSGVSSAAQGGSIWGTFYSVGIAGMLDAEDEELLVAALVGGNVGLLGGALLARQYDLTRPRVRWMNLGAIVGGLGGLGIDLLVEPSNDAVAIGIPLIASIGGLLIAAHTTRDMVPALGDAQGGDLDGALFGYGANGWSVGTPIPAPTMLPRDDVNGRREWRPGVRLELFRAKF
jgi:hypothetical protein